MGSVGDFFLGGNTQKQKSQNSSESSNSSQNQSQNSSVQGSVNNSSNSQGAASNSNGYNLSYGPIAAAMAPTLGYTAAGGNMLGAMLGIPGYSATGGPPVANPAPYAYHPPAPTSMPKPPAAANSGTSALTSLIALLSQAKPPAPAVPPTPTPSPVPTPTPSPSPVPGSPIPTPPSSGGGISGRMGQHPTYYAQGGTINAGQPAIVGEHQPEMFVPNTSGTIVPSVPGMGPDGRTPPPGSPPSPTGQFPLNLGMGGPMPGQMYPGGPGSAFAGHGGLLSGMFGGMGGFDGRRGVNFLNNHPGIGGGPGHPPVPTPTPTPAPAPAPVPGVTPPATPADPNPQGTALNNFFDSAGGKFLMEQGQNAINSNNSAGGFLQSGATGVALQKMGQGLASTYMNDYINHILDFSKLGLGGASAMSGAGGVTNSNSSSYGSGSSSGASYGNSQGTSSGSSTGSSSSQGTGTSSGHAKNGLIPDLAAFVPSGGGGAGSAAAAGA